MCNLKIKLISFICCCGLTAYVFFIATASPLLAEPIKVGWIGAMSGPISKYGAHQSAILAEEEINAAGGINGRPLKIIYEDGKGEGRAAVNAANKLINIDKVRYIIGGHCTPESLPIAALTERNKVLQLAAITSTPKLTLAGDYVFRVTTLSLRHAELEVEYAVNKLNAKSFAILHEETDYARPPAEHFAKLVKERDLNLVGMYDYHPDETDFRTILARIRAAKPDVFYIGVQSPESATQILQQVADLKFDNTTIFGNEITGNAIASTPKERQTLYEGLFFSEPLFDPNRSPTQEFIERYKKRYNVDNLPFGIFSAEAYDAVRLLAKVIADCGEDVAQVKSCLYKVNGYPGVSGPITIDKNGDGIRTFGIKKIINGNIVLIQKDLPR